MEHLLVLAGEQLPQLDLQLLLGNQPTLYDQHKNVVRYSVTASFHLTAAMKKKLSIANVDWAILPKRSFSEIGLIVSDMDSTFISIECIDELADAIGLKPQVAHITQAAMRGELDFESSLRKRVALLRGLATQELEKILSKGIQLSPGAQLLVEECHRHAVAFVLVSGGFSFFAEALKKKYLLTDAVANTLEIENQRLTGEIVGEIIDASAKAKYLKSYQAQYNLHPNQVIAVGDGANDISMLKKAGLSFAYHAKAPVKAIANFSIDFVGLEFIRHCFL
ncbi:MAG: phosphoserine phosphatase SerB [Neisseriaceae bacterium]